MPKGDYQRLKADIEDGIVPVARLLLEAVAMANLHGVAKGVLLFIWRRTYGWIDAEGSKHKTDRIKLEEFATAVNSERTYVSRQLKSLVKSNVITESSEGRYKRYGMNADVASWSDEVLDKERLLAAIDSKIYVHSAKRTLSYSATVVLQNNVRSLSSNTTVVPQDNCSAEQPLSSRTTQWLSSRTMFRDDNLNGGAVSEAPKESIEINKDLSATDATKGKPDDEVEIRMQIRTGNFNYRLYGKDYDAYRKLRTEGVDIQFILDGIDEAFATYQHKHSMDAITKFSYCAKRIMDRWVGEKSKKGGIHLESHQYGTRRGVNQSNPNAGQRIVPEGKYGPV